MFPFVFLLNIKISAIAVKKKKHEFTDKRAVFGSNSQLLRLDENKGYFIFKKNYCGTTKTVAHLS